MVLNSIEKKQMKDRVFVDTNVFVYLYSEDEKEKQNRALNALEHYDCVTSTQTLNEFCNVCLKKMRMPEEVVSHSIDEISEECEITLIDHYTVKKALALRSKYGYSYYDCLILASALACDCQYLLTEDLQNGQIIENKLKVVNIFKQ